MRVTSTGPATKDSDEEVSAEFLIVSEDVPTFIHWVLIGNTQTPFFVTPHWETLEYIIP